MMIHCEERAVVSNGWICKRSDEDLLFRIRHIKDYTFFKVTGENEKASWCMLLYSGVILDNKIRTW